MLTRHIYIEISFGRESDALNFVEATDAYPHSLIHDIAKALNLQILDSTASLYPDDIPGYTAFAALKESSIVMHTYAERQRVIFDFVVHDTKQAAHKYADVCLAQLRTYMPSHAAAAMVVEQVTDTWR